MNHENYILYQKQYRLSHGIPPRGAKKGDIGQRRRRTKLREMSAFKLMHEPINSKWIEAVNQKLRGE